MSFVYNDLFIINVQNVRENLGHYFWLTLNLFFGPCFDHYKYQIKVEIRKHDASLKMFSLLLYNHFHQCTLVKKLKFCKTPKDVYRYIR